MLAYWILFAFFGIGSLFERVDPRGDKRLGMLIAAWAVLVLMIGLRWNVGADWKTYLASWDLARSQNLGNFLWYYQRDPGFYALMWLFREANLPFWAFNLFLAAVFSTGLVAFARAQPSPWLALAIAIPYLVIVVAMSGVRQAAAIGLIFLALAAFRRQLPLRFLLFVILATVFHASAILVLPLAGFSFARTKFQSSILFLILVLGAFYSLGGAFAGYSERYLSITAIKSSGTIVRIGMNVIAAIIFFGYRKYFKELGKEYIFWRNSAAASLASVPIFFFVESTTALDRTILYLFPLQLLVFGAIPYLVQDRLNRLFAAFVTLIYLSLQLFVFLAFATNREAYLPYQTILWN